MKHAEKNKLNLRDVMISMGIIMAVWVVFWYPFEYFVFREDLSQSAANFIHISREFIRMSPAVLFFIYYKDSVKTNFKEMFSLKFNNEWFFSILLIFLADLCAQSYFANGKVYFNPEKITFYNVIACFSLALCQEFVFRGWSYNAFKEVTSRRNAVIISSAFFSVSHWFAHLFMFFAGKFNPADFFQVTIFTFIFGVVMCFIMIKTKDKSLVPLIIFHALWDFLTNAMH